MPTQQGIRLNNQEHLFPTASSPCEEEQENPIRLGTGGAFDLKVENDELLTKQHVFGNEFCPGASQITECSTEH